MRKEVYILKKWLSALLLTVLIAGCSTPNTPLDKGETQEPIVVDESNNTVLDNKIGEDLPEGYRLIEVHGGDLSGDREPNVIVDVGFGDREYYSTTNEHGQLIKVVADKITLQDESKEKVTSKGRYFRDEAKIPGTERGDLDEGHVIADSLGGVSNAYNITPQDSVLNRHGDQAYMEKEIREANGCTDFVAIISYPDTKTQIPSHYSYTYTINGQVINREFDNVNPDEANAKMIAEQKEQDKLNDTTTVGIEIISLDKRAEVIKIKNSSDSDINLTGWRIVSVLGGQDFIFPDFILQAGSVVAVGDSAKNTVDFHWLEGKGVWNNSKKDDAELYNATGELVFRYNGN